jgi:hypothetical protein
MADKHSILHIFHEVHPDVPTFEECAAEHAALQDMQCNRATAVLSALTAHAAQEHDDDVNDARALFASMRQLLAG